MRTLVPRSCRRLALSAGLAAAVGLPAGPAAASDPPDKVARTFDGGDSPLKRLQVSSDEKVVVGVREGTLHLLDLDRWRLRSISPCTVRSAAVVPDAGETWFVYAGCADGTVKTAFYDGRSLETYVPDGQTAEESVAIGQNPVVSLVAGGDGLLYGTVEGQNALRVHDYDPSSGIVDRRGGPAEIPVSGFQEAVLRDANPDTGVAGTLVVAHGDREVSQVTLGTGTVVSTFGAFGFDVDVRDITPALVSGVYAIDGNDGIFRYDPQATATGLLVVDGTLSGLEAGVITRTDDGLLPEYFILQDNARVKIWEIAADFFTPLGDPLLSFDVDGTAEDMVEGPAGYTLVGTEGGRIAVLTAHPWVDDLELSPTAGLSGTEVEVTFTVDEPGDWQVLKGGGRTGNGTVLASGTAEEIGEVTTSFVTDDTFDEGFTAIWVVHTSSEDGNRGWSRADFEVDNPPIAVGLSGDDLGFANRSLLLSFRALPDDSVDTYRIYVSDEAFTRSDHPEGGPAITLANGREGPFEVTPENGTVSFRVRPLENFVTYHVAVRAVDDKGQEGPMSPVLSEMPRPTLTAAGAAADPGGPACATGGGLPLGLGALGLGLVGLVRRRRDVALLALLAGVAGPAPEALAQDDAEEEDDAGSRRGRGTSWRDRFERDETPAWSSFELRYGSIAYADDSLKTIYGDRSGILYLEAGPQIFRVFEIDLGLGYLGDKGNTVDSGGTVSTEEVRMNWLPLSLGGTLRLHILDEQPIVPYALAGGDWVFWRETPLDADGAARPAARVKGSKFGWHWGAGGNILIDNLAPRRASRLEATTGINDTWLSIEYRQQFIARGGPGLDLSGWSISAGLKLDY